MRVYISVDMEGIAGIVHKDQVTRGKDDYERSRTLMTLEANAAALGAFDSGAQQVLINDSHADMRNLLLEHLDPRVEVLLGSQKSYSMAHGAHDQRFDVAMFVGYHGAAGTPQAILDHTYWGGGIRDVRVNGELLNEAALNALLVGAQGTPVGLVTGDEATCRQCEQLIPGIATVAVKSSVSQQAACTLHPERARQLIREAAAATVRDCERFKPYVVAPPLTLEVTLHRTGMADNAAMMPGAVRIDGRTVSYEAADAKMMFRALMTFISLAFAAA